ncbi:AzlD domain-containing protein [uncultured Clostridium sp.]|uniref:AzlD domain-containing protein n=1 Tax=uncultured Clostridium sp. TaxID=59620 RepID=UPI0025DEA378|nr:AzlD domain-containing protein [uncultured Clostridium sp.]
MQNNVYIYILIMAVVTYIIRALPITFIRKEIKNKTARSFLYYVPYVTLTVMTFPAILSASSSVYAAGAAFIVAVILAYREKSLFTVAFGSCFVVFVLEFIFRV